MVGPVSRLQALAFYDAIGYPPTEVELALASATGAVESPMHTVRGRVAFEGREALIDEQERREAFFPRKVRRAREVARFLAGLSGTRFVALCNTTALANARDEGDLDFFVITKTGTLMQTRGWSTLRFARSRPGVHVSDRDAVCLSYFVDDSMLDLSSHMLDGDDPYFRFWFLSLLPLYDDGVSADLWRANAAILAHHPNARPWMVNPDLRVRRPWWRIPTIPALDPLAARAHELLISSKLKAMRNLDTRVIVSPHVLKFHADDGRERFRDLYQATCKKYGVAT